MTLRLMTLALALGVLGCAVRGPSPALRSDLQRAEQLLSDGCHACLVAALATFERAAAAPRAPDAALHGVFRASVLLTLRARELGLDDRPHLDRAAAVATRLSTAPGRASPHIVLEAVALVSIDVSALANEARETYFRQQHVRLPAGGGTAPAREALAAARPSDLVAEYLALRIDCQDRLGRDRVSSEAAAVMARHPAPLVRYALALCGVGVESLPALRAADPRWVDTYYAEGRFEQSKFPVIDVSQAAEWFRRAHDAFPESLAIRLALAHARNALEQFAEALPHFDAVLARAPSHREALLGHVLALSYLGRHAEAIRGATRMTDLGTYLMGDAYYWRAWNRYHVHDLPAAWNDAEQATRLLVNTSVYTLAGVIAYARGELDTAIERLTRAFEMDRSNCDAVWTEGLVRVDKLEWKVAAARFAVAQACYTDAVAQARQDIAAADAAAAVEARARRVSAAEKKLATALHRRAQSAFNAASAYARLGDRDSARPHLAVAAEHPAMQEKAAALSAALDKRPQ